MKKKSIRLNFCTICDHLWPKISKDKSLLIQNKLLMFIYRGTQHDVCHMMLKQIQNKIHKEFSKPVWITDVYCCIHTGGVSMIWNITQNWTWFVNLIFPYQLPLTLHTVRVFFQYRRIYQPPHLTYLMMFFMYWILILMEVEHAVTPQVSNVKTSLPCIELEISSAYQVHEYQSVSYNTIYDIRTDPRRSTWFVQNRQVQ